MSGGCYRPWSSLAKPEADPPDNPRTGNTPGELPFRPPDADAGLVQTRSLTQLDRQHADASTHRRSSRGERSAPTTNDSKHEEFDFAGGMACLDNGEAGRGRPRRDTSVASLSTSRMPQLEQLPHPPQLNPTARSVTNGVQRPRLPRNPSPWRSSGTWRAPPWRGWGSSSPIRERAVLCFPYYPAAPSSPLGFGRATSSNDAGGTRPPLK